MKLPWKDFKKKLDEALSSTKEVHVFYDSDADGCTSAALFTLYLMKNYGKYPEELVSCFHDVDNRITTKEGVLNVVLDTSPKFDSESLVVIDHHIPKINFKKALVFNPRNFKKDLYMSTSCLVYRILDMGKEYSWISAIGVVADKSEGSCKSIIEDANSEFPGFEEILSKLVSMVSVSKNLDDSRIVVNSLVEAHNIGGPFFFGKTPTSSRLAKISKQVLNEAVRMLIKANLVYSGKNLEVYTIKSKYNVQSLVVNKLFGMKKDKTIVVANLNDVVHVEVRSNKSCYSKFEKALKDVVDDIGGHDQAFGMSLKKTNFHAFLEALKKL